MFTKQDSEKIKDIIREFLDKMTLGVSVEVFPEKEDGTVPVNLKMEEPQVLIGDRGQTLSDLQHLLKIIINKKMGVPMHIDLDIQDYKKKKSEYLREVAKSASEEVLLTKKEKILEPMTAYERRIIHMELAEREGIKTESIGEGEDRRVMVKPASQITPTD